MPKFISFLLVGSAFFLLACAQNDLPEIPVNSAPERATAGTGEMCGGIAGITCANSAEFCRTDIEAQCGAADQTGTCEAKPEFCTQQFDPVCGCDGKTYGNECTANSQGVSAAYKGECSN